MSVAPRLEVTAPPRKRWRIGSGRLGGPSFLPSEAVASARGWLRPFGRYRPAGASTELGQLLWVPPAPLIHPQARFLLVFSQKSACTNALIWFFRQLGHARAARDFHYWPHEYRERVYYRSELYQRAYELDLTTFKMIRVVRDPYERAVSSFRHLVRFGTVGARPHTQLRCWHAVRRGLSFAEYLDILERTDLIGTDDHHSIQHHPIESRLPVHYLINVSRENLFARLNQIEGDLGLQRTDMAEFPWIKYLSTHSRPTAELDGGSELYTLRLTRKQARNGPWPRYSALLTDEARARIAKLYAVDLNAYCRGP